jgi:hypothetical protein
MCRDLTSRTRHVSEGCAAPAVGTTHSTHAQAATIPHRTRRGTRWDRSSRRARDSSPVRRASRSRWLRRRVAAGRSWADSNHLDCRAGFAGRPVRTAARGRTKRTLRAGERGGGRWRDRRRMSLPTQAKFVPAGCPPSRRGNVTFVVEDSPEGPPSTWRSLPRAQVAARRSSRRWPGRRTRPRSCHRAAGPTPEARRLGCPRPACRRSD